MAAVEEDSDSGLGSSESDAGDAGSDSSKVMVCPASSLSVLSSILSASDGSVVSFVSVISDLSEVSAASKDVSDFSEKASEDEEYVFDSSEELSESSISTGTDVEAAVAATAVAESSEAGALVDAVTALLSSL